MTVIIAYIMDLIFGDPCWLPHPVKIMGYAIWKWEIILRRFIGNKRFAGIILSIIIIGLSWLLPFLLIKSVEAIHKSAGIIISIIIIYTTLSIKDLKVHAIKVYTALRNKNLESAREKISMMVGRDTNRLNEGEIIRAAVETIAENTVDGIISPLFFAFIGGAPIAIAYKAVNTLDSMVGYKNEKYIRLGWASAKIDDIVNFIPARITGCLIVISSFFIRKDGKNAFRIMLRDSRKQDSPNSGVSIAAMSGALGIKLGGRRFYQGELSEYPFIGEDRKHIDIFLIQEAITVSFFVSFLMVIIGTIIKLNL